MTQSTDPTLGYTGDCPTEPGYYLMTCMESDNVPEVIHIWRDEYHTIWAQCPDLGKIRLDLYHSGLTDIRWKKNG